VRALAPLLPEFFALYPEIELDFHITDDPVDLIAAGFDMAIKPGAVVDSTLKITRLVSLRTVDHRRAGLLRSPRPAGEAGGSGAAAGDHLHPTAPAAGLAPAPSARGRAPGAGRGGLSLSTTPPPSSPS
jgi:DNA-binding transcriptional LysR family regulator